MHLIINKYCIDLTGSSNIFSTLITTTPFQHVCYVRCFLQAYTPTFTAVEDLLQAIDLNDGYKYLPQLWSGEKTKIVTQILCSNTTLEMNRDKGMMFFF